MDPPQHVALEGVHVMTQDTRTTRDDLAVDFILGLTEGAETERAERLLQTDAQFATLVLMWREKMGEIDQTATEKAPAILRWDSLEKALDAPTQQAITKPASESMLASLWQNLSFWRPAAMAAGLAAVVLGFGLSNQLAKPPEKPVYVAVLQTGDGRAGAVVNAYADGTVTMVPLETIGVPEGRILEVWTLQTRQQGPVSVGRLDKARTLKLDLKALSRPDVGHLFEITLEPTGGSPTGKPTGPVLMKGLASVAL
jgi:anti-sigma-K factor RskA